MLRRIALWLALLLVVLCSPAGSPAGALTIHAGVMVYTPGPGGDGLLRPGGILPKSVSGDYYPVVGNFVGDGTQDIFWYAAGPTPDYLWEINGDGSHVSHPLSVNGNYQPVAGFFSETTDGSDNHDDIFWYAPGTAPDSLWDFNDDGSITKTSRPVNGTYTPVAGRFHQQASPTPDFGDDLLWLAGEGQSTMWDFNRDGSVTKVAHHLGSPAIPVVFSTGPHDDLFLYRTGPADDHIVDFVAGTATVRNVSGAYRPIVGYFDATPGEDIFWYGPGSYPDSQWSWNGTTFVNVANRTVNGVYDPVVGDFGGGYQEILWYRPFEGTASVWTFGTGSTYTTRTIAVPAGEVAIGLQGFSPAP